MIRVRLSIATALLLFAACGEGAPETAPGAPAAGAMPAEPELQELIQLPDDFAPEGIAITGTTFYVGSLAPPNVGQILRGDLRTGEYSQLVAATGTPALGLKHDPRSNLLFVAGGGSGRGAVYDAGSGTEVASYEFGTAPAMINDVVVTRDAAYFTDSQLPNVYRVALGTDGRPGEAAPVELPANFAEPGTCPGTPPIKGNGIAATPDGRYLILVHMSEGRLYRMETATGQVAPIEITGGDVCSADGLLLDGSTLYAVQNFLNRVAVVELDGDLRTGRLTRHITEPFASNPAIQVPTTIADAGEALYAVTAGFAEPSPDYVVRVEK
jgi:sugar lactone lactonase YvrE